MPPLIAEDLLLLLLDDRTGAIASGDHQPALGGALLIELAQLGVVVVEEKTRMWRSAKVRALPEGGVDDALLHAALAEVSFRERSAQDLVTRLGKGARDDLAERLVDRGIVQVDDHKVLGLFPRTRWPVVDPSRRDHLRHQLRSVLVEGAEPDERTGSLVALLSAVNRAHKVVEHRGVSSRQVRKRAKHLAEGAWAAKAVRDAIAASTAAVSAAAVGAAGAAGAG